MPCSRGYPMAGGNGSIKTPCHRCGAEEHKGVLLVPVSEWQDGLIAWRYVCAVGGCSGH